MKFLDPIVVTDAQLTSSSVVEAPPAAYNAGTTYALGNTCSTGTVGGVITAWESLQSANTGNTPSSSPTWWVSLGTTYSAYSGAVTYADNDIVLSATTHRHYQSVQASNTGHDPTTDDGTWWVDIGPTNRWACFDQAVGTITSAPEPIIVTLTPAETFNGLTLLDLVATSVQIEIDSGGPIYDETYTMEDRRLCTGWWDYFFMPLDPQTSLVVADLPPTGEITVTINASANAAVGTLAVGRIVTIGDTLRAPEIGIKDYSVKATDAYGVTTVTERGYAKTARYNVLVDGRRVDAVARHLAGVRATPVVWIGDDQYGYDSLLIYGFYADFGVVIAYPSHSECRLTVEGLST